MAAKFEACPGDTESDTVSRFGVPLSVVREAAGRYEIQDQTREEIADWLESIGY